MKITLVYLMLLTMSFAGCDDTSDEGDDQPVKLRFGDRCTESTECQDDLFCYTEEDANAGLCTRTCTTEDLCRSGYSCFDVENETGNVCLPTF